MKLKVKKAIEQSIEKWKKNYNTLLEAKTDNKITPHLKMGSTECPLCAAFYRVNAHCGGCPVNIVTKSQCEGSPYEKAYLMWDHHFGNLVPTDELLQSFTNEIEFLKSLLLEVSA